MPHLITAIKMALFVVLLVAFIAVQSRADLVAGRHADVDLDNYTFPASSTPGAQALYPPSNLDQLEPNAW
jgi:hypothetical protein